jgi:hypothetical protein
MPKDSQRIHNLLASVTEEFLGDGSHPFEDKSIRVERILLELVRPDPVQPRRVLPERIHFSFHENRLTPSQALRELVQSVQVAARQRVAPLPGRALGLALCRSACCCWLSRSCFLLLYSWHSTLIV